MQRYAGLCSECANFSDAPPIGEPRKVRGHAYANPLFLEGLEEADFDAIAEGAAHPTFPDAGGALTVVGFHDGITPASSPIGGAPWARPTSPEEAACLEIA